MKSANLRVRDVLEASGIDFEIRLLPDAVRTAQLAAEALGCAVGQIANSLIFKNLDSDTAVLVMCAGDRRVDLQKSVSCAIVPVTVNRIPLWPD